MAWVPQSALPESWVDADPVDDAVSPVLSPFQKEDAVWMKVVPVLQVDVACREVVSAPPEDGVCQKAALVPEEYVIYLESVRILPEDDGPWKVVVVQLEGVGQAKRASVLSPDGAPVEDVDQTWVVWPMERLECRTMLGMMEMTTWQGHLQCSSNYPMYQKNYAVGSPGAADVMVAQSSCRFLQ